MPPWDTQRGVWGGGGWFPSWKILYFWSWNRAIWWILMGCKFRAGNEFTKKFLWTWPKFSFFEKFWLKLSHISFFFPLTDKSGYFHQCTTWGRMVTSRHTSRQIIKFYMYAYISKWPNHPLENTISSWIKKLSFPSIWIVGMEQSFFVKFFHLKCKVISPQWGRWCQAFFLFKCSYPSPQILPTTCTRGMG